MRITVTVKEARELTGLGTTKLYELISDGKLRTTTVGRRRLIMVESILALLGITEAPQQLLGGNGRG